VEFNNRRQKLFRKSKSLLAEPVAWLLAVTYEPRNDGVNYNHEFEQLIQEQQAFLRLEIQKLNSSQGGRVEKILTESAHKLLEVCQFKGLTEEANRIRMALQSCTDTVRPKVDPPALDYPEAEPERVLGKTGNPIGLWR